jgi:hypothetical protein
VKKTMATTLKGPTPGLLTTDQSEPAGRVPSNTLTSGNRKAGTAKPSGQRVPKLTSSAGDLPSGSGTFSKTDPYARKPGSAGGR